MTNLNSEILNWIQFAKGDNPGHVFHGNQYSDGGVGAARELQSETENFRVGMNKGEEFPGGDNHREFAEAHDRLATSAPTPELRQGHEEAADLHREAAKLQDIAVEHNGYGDSGERADKASYDALVASKDATDDHINNVNKSATEIAKGDLPGHEFHGNQFTSAEANRESRGIASQASRVRQAESHTDSRSAHFNSHSSLAMRHADVGNSLNHAYHMTFQHPDIENNKDLQDQARGLHLAAQAHFAASKAHSDIAFGNYDYSHGQGEARRDEAEALSHAAAMATSDPQTLGRRANDGY